jgi:hypothetical protein
MYSLFKKKQYFYLAYFFFAILFLVWVLTTFRNVVHMDALNIIGTKMKNVLENNWHITDFVYQPLFPAVTSLSFTFLNAEFFHLNTVLEAGLGVLFLTLGGYRYLNRTSIYLNNNVQKTVFALLVGFIVFGLHKWEATFTGFFSFAVFFNLCICIFNYFFVFEWIDQKASAGRKYGLGLFILTNLLVIFEAPAYFYSYVLSVIVLLILVRRGAIIELNKRRWNIILGLNLFLLALTVGITTYLSKHPAFQYYASTLSLSDFLKTFFEKPFWIIKFYLIAHTGPFLGEAYNYKDLRALFGLFILVLYCMAIFYFWKKRDKRLIVPIALILYNIISYGFITMSRYTFNVVEYGASSRYTAFNLLGVLGIATFLFFYSVNKQKVVVRNMALFSLGLVVMGYAYLDWRQILFSPSRTAAFNQMKMALLTGENLEILQANKTNSLRSIEVLRKYKLGVYYEESKISHETLTLDQNEKIILISGDPKFTDLKKVGFYNNENGITWTNGNASISLNNYFQVKDTLLVEMDTYMPPVCKNVNPKISLVDKDNKEVYPFSLKREGDRFTYEFVFENPATVQRIKVSSETIDAGGDARVLSFPFKSLEIKKQ